MLSETIEARAAKAPEARPVSPRRPRPRKCRMAGGAVCGHSKYFVGSAVIAMRILLYESKVALQKRCACWAGQAEGQGMGSALAAYRLA